MDDEAPEDHPDPHALNMGIAGANVKKLRLVDGGQLPLSAN